MSICLSVVLVACCLRRLHCGVCRCFLCLGLFLWVWLVVFRLGASSMLLLCVSIVLCVVALLLLSCLCVACIAVVYVGESVVVLCCLGLTYVC